MIDSSYNYNFFFISDFISDIEFSFLFFFFFLLVVYYSLSLLCCFCVCYLSDLRYPPPFQKESEEKRRPFANLCEPWLFVLKQCCIRFWRWFGNNCFRFRYVLSLSSLLITLKIIHKTINYFHSHNTHKTHLTSTPTLPFWAACICAVFVTVDCKSPSAKRSSILNISSSAI